MNVSKIVAGLKKGNNLDFFEKLILDPLCNVKSVIFCADDPSEILDVIQSNFYWWCMQ